jgi:molecular chaperone DnaK
MVDYSNIPRDSRRVPLETRVQLKFDRFDGFISEYSSNLSPGGIFLRTRAPQPLGTVLDFAFRLGDGFELIRGRGEVVWNRMEDEGTTRPAGMGLRFLELSEGSKELIYRIVDQHILEGGTPYDVTQRPPDPLPAGPVVPPAAPPPVVPLVVSPAMTVLSVLPEDSRGTAPSALPVPPAAAPLEAPPLDSSGGGWPRPAPPPSDVFELPPPIGGSRALEPEEEALSWLPSPQEPPLGDPEPFPDLLSPMPHEPVPYEPLPYEDASAPAVAPPMFAATLGTRGARGAAVASRRRSRLPLVLLVAGVLLAAGLFLIRDQVMGWIGLGGDEETARASKPAAHPHRVPRAVAPGAVASTVTPSTPMPPPATSGPGAAAAPPAVESQGTAAPSPSAAAPASPQAVPIAITEKPQPPQKPASVPSPAPASAPPLPEPVTRVKPAAPSAPSAVADSGTPLTVLEKVTFEASAGGTDVILWGNGAFPASVYTQSRIDGNPPRELFRLTGIRQPFPRNRVIVGTAEVLQVRIGFHAGAHGGNELHVVLDLTHPNAVVTQVEAGPNRLKIHLQRR